MLLGFIAGIINKYVGEYFENIDASQLTGSLFMGGVTFHDINLRPTIFETTGLPFHVIAGKCGTLEIKYSITTIYSESVIVKVKDLFVLIAPTKSFKYDAEAEKQAEHQEKMRQLEVYEGMKHHIDETRHRRDSIPATVPKDHQDAAYQNTWIMQPILNIQVHVDNVHVRFEDDITKKADPFAVGVIIKEITVHTTDPMWKKHYLKDMPETLHKLVKINGLCAYWNPSHTVLYKGIQDKQQIFAKLATIPPKIRSDLGFKTLLGPIGLELKVQITVDPENTKTPFSKPKIRIDSDLKEFLFTLTDKQVHDILPFIDTLDVLTRSLTYRKYRPEIPGDHVYRGHYKQWWKFAYRCTLEDIQRRRNNFRWKVIKAHREKCLLYLKAYYKRTVHGRVKPEIEQQITSLESEFDLFTIILLRKHAELIGARKERVHSNSVTDAAAHVGLVSSTYNWVWSWFQDPSPPTPAMIAPSVPQEQARRSTATGNINIYSSQELSKADKEDLRIAVGFAKNVDIVHYPQDYTDFELSLLLLHCRLQIHKVSRKTHQSITILDMIAENLNIEFNSRPVNDGMFLQLRMGRIEAYGGDFPDSLSHESLLATQLLSIANPSSQDYFLKFLYEMAPTDTEVDHRVNFEGLALQFTYNQEAIDRLADCFTVPREKGLKIVGSIPAVKVLKNLQKFKTYSANKLLRLMEEKGKVEVNICLISPYILIPQDLSTSVRKSTFFVVQMGEINIAGTVIGGTLCEHGGCSSLV